MNSAVNFCSILTISYVLILMVGCSQINGYNSQTLPPLESKELLDGEALIYMPPEEVDWVYSGNPSSFANKTTSFSAPIGYITQQIAVRAFSEHFITVNTTSKLLEMADYQFTIQPRVMSFEYTYNCRQTLGAITPEVLLKLYIRAYDSEGKLILDKIYSSGKFKGKSCAATYSPSEKISAALHQAMWVLMAHAADDIKSAIL
jgi:hypothetical protein